VGPSTGNLLAGSIIFGISVTTIQVIGMLAQLLVPWPKSIMGFVELSRYFVLDANAIRMECVVGKSPLDRYATMFMLPFLVAAMLGCLTLLSLALPRLSRRRLEAWTWRRLFNTICHMGQALFISVTVIAALPMQCYRHPNGKSTVVSFQSVLCFEGEATHTRFLLMSFSLLLLVVLPFCAIAAWGSYSVYVGSQTQGATAPQLTMYRFLIYRFRPGVWWWGNVFNVRQFLLGLTPLVAPDDAASQLAYFLFVAVVYLVLTLAVMPWRTLEINFFDALTTGFVMAIGISMTTFIPASRNEGTQTALLVLLTILTLACMGAAGLYGLVMMYMRGRKGDFGVVFPRPKESSMFADFCRSIIKEVADLDPAQHRKLLEDLPTVDRLLIDQALTVFMATSRRLYLPMTRRNSTTSFHRSLCLVHCPAEEEEETASSSTACCGDLRAAAGEPLEPLVNSREVGAEETASSRTVWCSDLRAAAGEPSEPPVNSREVAAEE